MNRSLQNDLSSLGCNFAIQEFGRVADPELTLIHALDFFWRDKKMFSMLIALLKYRLHHLINTKRLFVLSKNLSSDRKILLKVISKKVAAFTGDLRFLELDKKIEVGKKHRLTIQKKYQDPFYVQRRGYDKDFGKLGYNVAQFFDDQPERKLKTFKRIYSENHWLRLRALVGPDYRADALYLLKTNPTTTQSDLAKILGCNKSSISRIWSSLKNVEDLVSFI
jgi:hypothetical protein